MWGVLILAEFRISGFPAVIVFGLVKDILFKSILRRCEFLSGIFEEFRPEPDGFEFLSEFFCSSDKVYKVEVDRKRKFGPTILFCCVLSMLFFNFSIQKFVSEVDIGIDI